MDFFLQFQFSLGNNYFNEASKMCTKHSHNCSSIYRMQIVNNLGIRPIAFRPPESNFWAFF